MKKLILFLAVISIYLLTSCKYDNKKQIDFTDVSSIDIMKRTGPLDTVKCFWKHLTELQVKSFVNKWNNATDMELRKYLPTYEIVVYLKNDSTRQFRVGGRFIKETNDWCADFVDNDYFDKLYSEK